MSKSPLSARYDPAQHEQIIYDQWQKAGIFQPSASALKSSKKPFVIMLPPPNITGNLHMGHALQDTIMDILTRYHRMLGDPTLWVPGTDHAAIGTNRVIEEQLHAEGKTRWDLGREAFLQRTEAWYQRVGSQIIGQMKRLGCSCDWSRTRFTLDKEYNDAVQTAFIEYHQKGYIYRGARLVNWDPTTKTTVSDLEVEWRTEKAPLYKLKYGPFVIITARPETKFGDKYVVMHPDDERYQQYQHGHTLTVEWINGLITATIIKDKAVDPKFGTGVMTMTPWHDAVDFDIAQRHDLDMEQIIDFEGKLLPIAGELSGLPITKARARLVDKLKEKNLLVDVDENYTHNIAVNERGKGVIEPQVMRQWFVDMSKLKGETIEVVEKELVQFFPRRWKKHFLTWMHNVRDWNINRQIWLGHRLPVWWKPGTHGTDHEEGNFVVSIDRPAKWEQDPDTLDTWFSSALWPFAALGWPQSNKDLQTFYPTSVLTTAREITYLWVARMIFSGLELLQQEKYGRPTQAKRIPFKQVFIHPVLLAKSGQRMSKSLGTGVDPLQLIDKYGADATRFGLMYQMTYDQQAIKYDDQAIVGARNFASKLWNIVRLVESLPDQDQPTLADQWITQRCQEVAGEVSQLIDTFKFGEAARLLHAFVWKDVADWYLEILKHQGSTIQARHVLTITLQLLHPFMPHLTEVLWAQLSQPGFIAQSAWPHAKPTFDKKVAHDMQYFQEVIHAIRSTRTLLELSPTAPINLWFEKAPALTDIAAKLVKGQLQTDRPAKGLLLTLPSGHAIVLTADAITTQRLERAQAKLREQIEQLTELIARQEKQLTQMMNKAPEDKIAILKTALAHNQTQLKKTEHSLDQLKNAAL